MLCLVVSSLGKGSSLCLAQQGSAPPPTHLSNHQGCEVRAGAFFVQGTSFSKAQPAGSKDGFLPPGGHWPFSGGGTVGHRQQSWECGCFQALGDSPWEQGRFSWLLQKVIPALLLQPHAGKLSFKRSWLGEGFKLKKVNYKVTEMR